MRHTDEPPVPVPSISASQMREVDRIMIEDLGIGLEMMMENAGRSLADLAIRRFSPSAVTVLAGMGGNGGGGLSAARHLFNRGVQVAVCLADRQMSGVPARQLAIVESLGIPFHDTPPETDLFIDALVGYSLSGPPRGRVADLIRLTGTADVLALDIPSGLDPDRGIAHVPAVAAKATMTLALPKRGLVGAREVGELYLADISVPASVYAAFGVRPGVLFEKDQVIRIEAQVSESSPTV